MVLGQQLGRMGIAASAGGGRLKFGRTPEKAKYLARLRWKRRGLAHKRSFMNQLAAARHKSEQKEIDKIRGPKGKLSTSKEPGTSTPHFPARVGASS
ncbi:uncharacterized protein A4U43_C10F17670 [Asparagus officinalis]|uniref:Uncharacterized protein n=1 Tax=Asparagus officinalis TaxID=4686 RepID=A0A5P1E3K8_ASPOF|nr:uncharacterized protein A4U43_C10F17670 [Asparagus officinalis]